MIVIDASALIEVLLHTSTSWPIEDRLYSYRQSLHAPHLIDIEIAQVVRRLTSIRDIDEEQGRQALATLADWPLRRYAHHPLLSRVWELRDNFSAYDAVYVALAEVLDARLLTCDRRLAAAANGIIPVDLV